MTLTSKFGRVNMVQSHRPLDTDQIARVAPSVFTAEAHESRSSRYAPIPTAMVLEGLQREGFVPFMAAQAMVRKPGKRDFAKHMLRLRHHANMQDGEDVNEIILLNSHDGSSSYQMLAGCFRFVCCNGMVLGDTMSDIRIRHTGDASDVVGNVIEGAYQVLNDFERIDAHKDDMRHIIVPAPAQHALAAAAIEYRYGPTKDENGEPIEGAHIPVRADQILTPRRWADKGDDLWRVFNRLQENLTKGGIPGRAASGRRQRTRAVTGIDSDVKLNRALWSLTEHLKEALV